MDAQYYVKRPHLLSSSNTIEQFSAHVADLYTKAVTLHDAATKLSARDRIAWHDPELATLDKEIDRFVAALPEVLSPPLLVVHVLAHLATIQLHAPLTNYHESSRTTALSAARSVSDILVNTEITNVAGFDAVLAPLLSTTTLVFIAEISRRLREGATYRVQVLRTQLETVIQAMQQFAHHSPLIVAPALALRPIWASSVGPAAPPQLMALHSHSKRGDHFVPITTRALLPPLHRTGSPSPPALLIPL
ncbi:hypothetical protein DFH08DRAFT_1086911 [Mycena albidolilacea]|uniref:Uncharacterized protein n=1 Tax=Mycena albidolilacea TaxID=1033008 RepID=A0AAD6ZC37_9AGAR|nr:hypothetical protein DFH08DRAFT_1086911 [Mycena albidolilacea]